MKDLCHRDGYVTGISESGDDHTTYITGTRMRLGRYTKYNDADRTEILSRIIIPAL